MTFKQVQHTSFGSHSHLNNPANGLKPSLPAHGTVLRDAGPLVMRLVNDDTYHSCQGQDD